MKKIVAYNVDIVFQLWDLFKRRARDGFIL